LAGVGAVLLLMPLYLYALVALAERGTLLARALSGRVRAENLHDGVLEHRSEVVEAVVEAI
jgi:hypothetical protein